jgi:hypothetical protein
MLASGIIDSDSDGPGQVSENEVSAEGTTWEWRGHNDVVAIALRRGRVGLTPRHATQRL